MLTGIIALLFLKDKVDNGIFLWGGIVGDCVIIYYFASALAGKAL